MSADTPWGETPWGEYCSEEFHDEMRKWAVKLMTWLDGDTGPLRQGVREPVEALLAEFKTNMPHLYPPAPEPQSLKA
jgi:hypothetical protein